MTIRTIFIIFITLFFHFPVQSQINDLPRKSVNGKEFYIYKINSGEGLYAIGRTFNISQDEIIKYNPDTQYGLKAGQELLIPISPASSSFESDNYFSHTIQAGETIYNIANTYNVSPNEIIALNPGSDKSIKIGFALKIPRKKITDPSGYTYHTIAPKETLFSVARLYNVPVESLINENPGIEPRTFTTGKVIRIKGALSEKKESNLKEIEEKRPEPEKKVSTFDYKVKKRETLFSISKQFNVSIESIIACNPGLKKLNDKMTIKIPVEDSEKREPETANNNKKKDNKVSSYEDSLTVMLNLYDEKQKTEQAKEINIGLMLPFRLNTIKDSKSAMYIEFYEGFLLAVEQLKQSGANINVYTYDTEDSEKRMQYILSRPEVKKLDLIIGPENDKQIKMLSDFGLANNINIVNSFSLKNDEVAHNSKIFQTNIPHPYLYAETTQEFCKRFKNRNIVLISDELGTDKNKQEFLDALTSELKRQGLPYSKIKSSDLRDAAGVELLNSKKPIVFVPTSGDTKALSVILPEITLYKTANKDLEISLFGYPEWQTFTNKFIDDFYALDTYIFTRFYTNPLDKTTKNFYKDFKFWYSKDLMKKYPQFGILGYDTGMFFLNALYKYGKNFDRAIQNLDAQSIQTDFYFQRINNWGGFINKGIYFVNFRPDFTINKIEIR